MVKAAFLSPEPVKDTAAFIGREVELGWLADKLSRQTPQNCNLIGESRIGKTSLLYQVYQQKIGLQEGEGGLYIWVRLAELRTYRSIDFWRVMAQKLCAEQLKSGLLAEPMDISPEANAAELFDELDECLERLLDEAEIQRMAILIDDFDLLLGENGIGKRDLDWLRSLMTRYGEALAFVITSSDSLVSLTDFLLNAADVSPMANLFHHHSVGLLTQNAAQTLCRRAAEVEEMPLSEADLAFLLQEAGRHPDWLKVACGYLFAAYRHGEGEDARDVAASDVRLDGRIRGLSRRLIRRRLAEEQALLRMIGSGTMGEGDRILITRLRKHLGLVERRGGQLALFADAFQYWVQREPVVDGDKVVDDGGETAVSEPFALRHDKENRLVEVAGQTVRLTPLENRLLDYFIRHADQVCTLDSLLQDVWGPGKSKAVVEKGVNRLRTKIEQDPKRPRHILAARGEGYILRLTA